MDRVHGGDWAAFEREYGAAPLDFSANVSPLGVPEGVRAAIAGAIAGVDRYPDPRCRALCDAIAAHDGVPAEQVLCGNGASELIWLAVRASAPKRALVTAPCFGEYEAALAAVGCEITRYPMTELFSVGADFLKIVDNNINIIMLCNPNNPTGRTIRPDLLHRIVERCAEAGTRLLLDECFVDFLDEPGQHTAVGWLGEYPNLVILKAFTKLYALPGVRLGYVLCADAAFLESMRRCAPPWSVSTLAQAAGRAALREENYVNQVRQLVRTERTRLCERLCSLGLRVVPGEANYLLFRSQTPLDAPLRERGILLRRCDDFHGLDGTWYRAAVRTKEENDRLIAAIVEVLT